MSCDVDTWRGQFIKEFALAESAISETLAFLATVASEGAETLTPHLVGARFATMKSLVNPQGPLAVQGYRVALILGEFGRFHTLRNYICHGTSEITFDNHRQWRLSLHLLTFRGTKIERTSVDLTQEEADLALSRLRSARIRLDGQLRGLVASFAR